MRYYDAHCHLQDERIAQEIEEVLWLYRDLGVRQVVVNGTSDADWRRVAALCEGSDVLRPSFGLHPWKVGEADGEWRSLLSEMWDQYPVSGVGEIGLDRWVKGHDLSIQEPAFLWQLDQGLERGFPVSIHCLQAWGRMLQLLKERSLPSRGFLLHSYGGPKEMVKAFADLGAYFSISAYFAHERKYKQREALRQIPLDRLLIETDAPDMRGPDGCCGYSVGVKKELNHPANIVSVYRFVAQLFEVSEEALAAQVEENYQRFFETR